MLKMQKPKINRLDLGKKPMTKTHLNATLQTIRNILSQTYYQLGENLRRRQSGSSSLCRILSVCLIIIQHILYLIIIMSLKFIHTGLPWETNKWLVP